LSAKGQQKALARPDHRFFTILLLKAIEAGADAICFGFRSGIVGLPTPITAPPKLAGDKDDLDRNANTRGPAGSHGVPISLRANGVLEHFADQPFHSYGMILKAIQFRPVAIGASPVKPQPLRYVEIDAVAGTGNRRFVEVDFEYQIDNTFWVLIRGVREASESERLSDTMF
jgi:hypothetical protein